jgi:hypothetical protein
MRRGERFNGYAPALLLALIAYVAVAAHAEAPSLQGTYLNEQQSAKTIESAIETTVAKMNFIKRPIARSRLKKTNSAHRRVDIRIGASEISVAFDGNKPVQMPADGSTTRWTREDGEAFDVNAAWDGDRRVSVASVHVGRVRLCRSAPPFKTVHPDDAPAETTERLRQRVYQERSIATS